MTKRNDDARPRRDGGQIEPRDEASDPVERACRNGHAVEGEGYPRPEGGREWLAHDRPPGVGGESANRPDSASEVADSFTASPDPAAATPGEMRCIAGPRPDGGTELGIVASADRWDPAFLGLLAGLPFRRTVPVTIGSVEMVARRTRTQVVLSRGGVCTIQVDQFRGSVTIVAAREALWRPEGVAGFLNHWIPEISTWVGLDCIGLGDAYSVGWRVRHLELAGDFVGICFVRDDAGRFTGRGTGRTIETDRAGETIEIGSRKRNGLQVACSDKSSQIRRCDKIEPGEAIYAPAWRAGGWDGERPVYRVEVRANGKQLALESKETGEVVDLRDPAVLLSSLALGRLWRRATTRHRLTDGDRDRTRRSTVPTRWQVVIEAGDALPERMVLHDDHQPMTLARRCRRELQHALLHLCRWIACLAALNNRNVSQDGVLAAEIRLFIQQLVTRSGSQLRAAQIGEDIDSEIERRLADARARCLGAGR